MSSLHRQIGRPYWFCSYRGADGKQHFKSTGTTNKAEAKIVCTALGKGERMARKRRLTPDAARRIIETALAELLDESGQALPLSTTRAFFVSWLKQKETDGAESSYARYKGIVERFLAFLGPRADLGLSSLTTEDVNTFIIGLTDEVSSGTVNTYLKVLRVALGRAVKRQLIPRNPASLVDTLRGRDRHERRAFKLDELRRLYELADAEWRTMILFGLYTGLRLQDVATQIGRAHV